MEDDLQAPVAEGAPAPVEAEAAPAAASDITPESAGEQQSPISLEDAFARATAEASGPGPDSPEPPEEGRPQTAPVPEVSAEEAAVDRIHAAIRENRISELPAPLRRRAEALVADTSRTAVAAYEEERQLMNGLRGEFLQLETMRVEDPDAFHELMWNDGQSALRREFYDYFRAAYPGVTPDSPGFKAATQTPDQARQEAVAAVFGDMDSALGAIARDAGIAPGRLDEIRSAAGGPWQFLSATFTEAVRAGAEKQREAIRREERRAAEMEAQARYAHQTVVTPRNVGSPVGAPARDGSKRMTLEDAFAEAVALQGQN